jgi:Xaa-Pro aminopeptidase
MRADHAARRDRLRALISAADADAALITRLVNVRYLTGFTGSNAALLVTAVGGECLATDGRYTTQAAVQAPDVEAVIERAAAATLAGRAAAGGVRRLAFEAHDVTVELHEALVAAAESAVMVPLGHAVEELRAVKDEAEVALIAAACAIADRALADVLPGIVPGRTEREVAAELETRMRAYGADGAAFETICATGPNSAIPHHRPTDRVLARGDLLKLDFGARRAGYHSDMTRTFSLGPAADWQAEIHALVATAQAAGRAALAVDADVQAVDAAARDVIAEAGYGEQYPHGLGHGIGLEIHEAPSLGTTATGRLAAGMPVTVEPGVYLPGRGGVRIEDTLVVRSAGPELLTTTTRQLLAL